MVVRLCRNKNLTVCQDRKQMFLLSIYDLQNLFTIYLCISIQDIYIKFITNLRRSCHKLAENLEYFFFIFQEKKIAFPL